MSVSLMCLPGPSAQFPLWCFFPSDFTWTGFLYLLSGGATLRMSEPSDWRRRHGKLRFSFLLLLLVVDASKKKKKEPLAYLIYKCHYYLLWLLVYHCKLLLGVCCCDTFRKKKVQKGWVLTFPVVPKVPEGNAEFYFCVCKGSKVEFTAWTRQNKSSFLLAAVCWCGASKRSRVLLRRNGWKIGC